VDDGEPEDDGVCDVETVPVLETEVVGTAAVAIIEKDCEAVTHEVAEAAFDMTVAVGVLVY